MATSMVEVVENAVSNQEGSDDNPRPGDFTFDACLHCISPTALVWVSVRTAFRFSCRSHSGNRWRRCSNRRRQRLQREGRGESRTSGGSSCRGSWLHLLGFVPPGGFTPGAYSDFGSARDPSVTAAETSENDCLDGFHGMSLPIRKSKVNRSGRKSENIFCGG